MGVQTFGQQTTRPLEYLKGNAIPQIIRELVSGSLPSLTIIRTKQFLEDTVARGNNSLCVFLSKAQYDSLVSGAITPAPATSMINYTDDYCIPNMWDIINLINGTPEVPGNLKIANSGSGAKASNISYTVPIGLTLDLGHPILQASSDGVNGGIASVDLDTGVITFAAGEAGFTLNVSYTFQEYTMIGIVRGAEFTPQTTIDPQIVDAVILSPSHYDYLLTLNP